MMVNEGKLKVDLKDSLSYVFRVLRDEEIVYDGILEAEQNEPVLKERRVELKRFKDIVEEVRPPLLNFIPPSLILFPPSQVDSGMECGFSISGFDGFKEGDVVECYQLEVKSKKIPRMTNKQAKEKGKTDVDAEEEEIELDEMEEDEEGNEEEEEKEKNSKKGEKKKGKKGKK